MLQALHITDFALIDRLSLSFSPGLNILTGETGAGKSIIIDALGLVLGERASGMDLVRTGAKRALVEAEFNLSDAPPEILEKLGELGLSGEDDILLISRELSRESGKSQCRVNARLMPVSVLKEIGDYLVDVHGQHEHQSLLSSDKHIDILDNWCGRPTLALRAEVGAQVSAVNTLKRELEQLRVDSRERARTLDLYRFQKQEIDDTNLSPGEEEDLLAERIRLSNSENLSSASAEAYAHLSGAERAQGAIDLVNAALAAIELVSDTDPKLGPITESLRGAVAYVEDAAFELRSYQDGVEYDPQRLEEVEARLDALRTLKRKYGDSIEEILTYAADLTQKLDRLESSEAHEQDLSAAIEKAMRGLEKDAAKLTEIRKAGAANFALKITRELADLGMEATRFETAFAAQPVAGKGADRVEFLLSPNPGEPLRPLAKIASGGEMSRIMLAIKSVMARTGGMPTMIFDEIDAGVGGRTAQVLGDKLDALGKEAQILCITHLPHIASRADSHFFIEKQVENGRTTVHVNMLDNEQRVDEIARMLGGNRRSEAVVQHAREMLAVG